MSESPHRLQNAPAATRASRYRWLLVSTAAAILSFAAAVAWYHRAAAPDAVPHAQRPGPESPREVAVSRLPAEASSGPIQLADVSASSGVVFQHTDGGSGEKYLVETVSAGVALFDYDHDGLTDIYLLNGSPLPPALPDSAYTNALYRNEGDFQFRDVTAAAGVGDTGFGLGVAAADYDGDGYLDLYVSNFGSNVLYHNNGDGTFQNRTVAAGVTCDATVGAGTAFLDADLDGDLDLFVANYITFAFAQHQPRSIDGYPCYPGPLDYAPAQDLLFRNNGDGTFADISAAAGIAQVAGTGMGVVCADYDNDGDTDIFVVNDEMANQLFENDGTGHFADVAMARGCAFDLHGQPQGNMGVDCGDYDNDGWLDFFSTSFSRELPVLYQNNGGQYFADRTLTSSGLSSARPHVNWGTAFADFDNDRWLDLYIACGHIDQQVHLWNCNTAFQVSDLVLRNLGNGQFADESPRSGSGLRVCQSSRGIGVDDLDNDGDLDVVVLNSRGQPSLLRNDSPSHNAWLQVETRSVLPNRYGVRAQVRVAAGGLTQMAEVHSGRGYQSQHGYRIQFGLGACRQVDSIEVRWPGGGRDVWEQVPTNQRVLLVQGTAPTPDGSTPD